jgi:hypothetical protein
LGWIDWRIALCVLDWWTWAVGIGAEDTAIARFWPQDAAAAGTNIDDLTCIHWHDFFLDKATLWAANARNRFHYHVLPMPPQLHAAKERTMRE